MSNYIQKYVVPSMELAAEKISDMYNIPITDLLEIMKKTREDMMCKKVCRSGKVCNKFNCNINHPSKRTVVSEQVDKSTTVHEVIQHADNRRSETKLVEFAKGLSLIDHDKTLIKMTNDISIMEANVDEIRRRIGMTSLGKSEAQ
jgi:hypothetical protein